MGTEERQLTTGAEMEVMRPQAEGCQQPPSREELEATGTAAPLRPRRQRSPADTWVWLGKDLGLRPLAREEAAPSVTSPSSRPFVPAATGDLVPAGCRLAPSLPLPRPPGVGFQTGGPPASGLCTSQGPPDLPKAGPHF